MGEDLFADSRPRAVGKRTPRISVGSIQNRDNRKLGSCAAKARQEDDEEAHMAAMALADVFQRGGSTQVCYPLSSDVAIVKVVAKKMKCAFYFFIKFLLHWP